tara:strand:+ start:233 stop:1060 length:828 start_codon:yes stop_codon:yes gene_type:complete
MKLIRTLHESINEYANLIIFCENKILYDQNEKSYIFNPKDLNLKEVNGPFLAIAKVNDRYIYVINIDSKDEILGIFMNPNDTNFVDLINILTFLDNDSFLLISRASMLNNWNINNSYCSYCGNNNEFDLEEGAFSCKCKKAPNYPSISPCIITLIYDEQRILLGRNKFFPKNMYSTLAGFIEAGENAEQALIREILEEVNVKVSKIEYHSSQSWPFPSQLMLGYKCKYESGEIILNDKELEDAKWFNINELPNIPPETSISGKLIRSYIEDHLKL